jgi:hypothetical protein
MAYSEKYKRILHRMGYYDYQEGLIHRHLNQGDGWNSHLENCRKYIIGAVKEIKPEKVTVLGSGWLLDLPLAEILDIAHSVTLIDIVHPPDAQKQVASLKGVELVEADATGGLVEEVWEKRKKTPFFRKIATLEDIVVPVYEFNHDPGLVISLNILSQLDVLPVAFLKKRSNLDESEILSFRKKIQENHIRFLLRYKSVLITDICEIFTDSTGNTTDIQTVVTGLPDGDSRREWTWDFDLRRSDYFEKSSVMKVIALILTK